MHFETFSAREIIQAAHKTRIRDLSSLEELKQALRYVITLIGLKAENMPSESQKMVLIDFIQSELANYTPEEIRIAFKLAVAKKFPCDVIHFQNFNAIYLAVVMDSYSSYKAKAMQEFKRQLPQETKQPSEEEIKSVFYKFTETFITKKFEQYKATGILEGTLSGFQEVFKCLEQDLKLINLQLCDKQAIYETAVQIQKKKVDSKQFSSIPEMKDFKRLMRKALQQGFEATFENEIKNICCEIAVKQFYDGLIQSNRDLRSIIETIKNQQHE
jgi:hypothetical protein